MEFHYMDGGPFETVSTGDRRGAKVLGYDAKAKTFLALRLTGETFWGTAANFDQPPPIPAAARKPQAGEVWSSRTGKQSFFIVAAERADDQLLIVAADGEVSWWNRCNLTRPATPEEAEPFRPILEGLKRSLGEA